MPKLVKVQRGYLQSKNAANRKYANAWVAPHKPIPRIHANPLFNKLNPYSFMQLPTTLTKSSVGLTSLFDKLLQKAKANIRDIRNPSIPADHKIPRSKVHDKDDRDVLDTYMDPHPTQVFGNWWYNITHPAGYSVPRTALTANEIDFLMNTSEPLLFTKGMKLDTPHDEDVKSDKNRVSVVPQENVMDRINWSSPIAREVVLNKRLKDEIRQSFMNQGNPLQFDVVDSKNIPTIIPLVSGLTNSNDIFVTDRPVGTTAVMTQEDTRGSMLGAMSLPVPNDKEMIQAVRTPITHIQQLFTAPPATPFSNASTTEVVAYANSSNPRAVSSAKEELQSRVNSGEVYDSTYHTKRPTLEANQSASRKKKLPAIRITRKEAFDVMEDLIEKRFAKTSPVAHEVLEFIVSRDPTMTVDRLHDIIEEEIIRLRGIKDIDEEENKKLEALDEYLFVLDFYKNLSAIDPKYKKPDQVILSQILGDFFF